MRIIILGKYDCYVDALHLQVTGASPHKHAGQKRSRESTPRGRAKKKKLA